MVRILLSQIFLYAFFYLFASEVALEYLSVRTKEDNLWDASYAIGVATCTAGIKYLGVGDMHLFDSFLCGFGFVPGSYTEHFKVVSLVFVVYLYECGYLGFAWSTPTCPKIYEYVFAFAYVVAEFVGLSVVSSLKIDKHLSFT